MTYIMHLLLLGLVLGFICVASNPSPYFAALGLVAVAGLGCGVLAYYGASFLSLVLFLVYLGGMLVVFAYSAALAAEPYPEAFGSRNVSLPAGAYLWGTLLSFFLLMDEWYEFSWVPGEDYGDLSVFRADAAGAAMMYSSGGGMLLMGGWVLLLTLFVVLEITRGLSRGTLRAV
uniref:NADH-ubiquinone oxidoreductase chain 6 n=1 Tax=Cryptopsaras couesii TaxID=412659 RepID=A0A6B9IQ40_CRYCE|nr:NADH dehydrogenase subunit 6 [Cryptopsaras couesii]QGZ08796.1 NADH dehydrogenase subunit 6 [Cryptopsaras couesii]QGZ08820.1 NADH dehydrogenase subunit 6 [Cryptopsaras couesii]QGZ08823.1 NADH dehydrogenase subunit 6 [Cryptopsaras couesii]QGZ08846.1 NADH dehydrogenase subunit 6 [Cryptopsaras couesii]